MQSTARMWRRRVVEPEVPRRARGPEVRRISTVCAHAVEAGYVECKYIIVERRLTIMSRCLRQLTRRADGQADGQVDARTGVRVAALPTPDIRETATARSRQVVDSGTTSRRRLLQ